MAPNLSGPSWSDRDNPAYRDSYKFIWHDPRVDDRQSEAPDTIAFLAGCGERTHPVHRREQIGESVEPVTPSAIENSAPRGGSFVELRSYRVADDVLRLLGRGSGILTIDSQTPGAPALVDYLDVLRRRKWPFIIAVVLVPVIAVAFSTLSGPKYEGSAQVLLNYQDISASLTPGASTFIDRVRAAETEVQLARLAEVARRTTAAAGVKGMTVVEFLKSSSVSPAASSDLLKFSVTDSSPEAAKLLATSYAQEFAKYRRELDSQEFRRIFTNVQTQLAQPATEGGGRLHVGFLRVEFTPVLRKLLRIGRLRATWRPPEPSP